MAQTSSLNCLSCRNPYQTPHSLNPSPLFTENPFLFTEKCFVGSPAQKSALIEGVLSLVKLASQNLSNHCGRKRARNHSLLIGGVPTTPDGPDPNTSAKVSRCKWEAYRDTNWWCICYFLPTQGHTFAEVCDRNGRCIATLFKNIGVKGRCDSPALRRSTWGWMLHGGVSQIVPKCPVLSSFVLFCPLWGPERGQNGTKRTTGTKRDISGQIGKGPHLASTPIFRSRPGKPNQRKGQNEKFMNFAHFVNSGAFPEENKHDSH